MSMNNVQLQGNLTRDIETSYTTGGTMVARTGIAVNETWTKDGQKHEETMFVDLVCFGKQGEFMAKYFEKGKPILVEGKLKLEQWESKDGQKRSKHTVTVYRAHFQQGGKHDRPKSTAQDVSPTPPDLGGDEIPF